MKHRIRFSWKKFAGFIGFNIVFAALLAPFIVFYGPFEALKVMAVGSINTSRHPQVVRAFLSTAQIDQIMHEYEDALGVNTESHVAVEKVTTDPASGIEIQNIQGHSFKGKVMLIKNPKRVKVAVTDQLGVTGERVTDFVKQTGAIAGINAGGFNDPNGKGNGAFPEGLTVHDGKLVYNSAGNATVHELIGLDSSGKLFIGPMSASELAAKHIQEAVTFFGPTLIENGKPVVVGDGGIGIAPRTGIGQTADGTIIFVVIDGRQPTWSWGATARDLMNVFLEYHAVNAVNLDGGSSTEMVYQGKIINRLWDIFGERYIPTAFVVMPK
ncbi:Phosphodiester glycosidase [Acididesulfobacillus acetoxydans]|uniref:Exopolysaccharide biosynthesis protein n=1 Tax=Acididesulfobacillus acetoxydans TaxID=1561005 RepID=A0A8S0XC12_9FIRM|nr:phosphodiester glycosidase family protein [Acididesulfobacillus acetoxydans]CAA7601866.1 Phosphodiester glycosidase [Acididesulfobacillus acetoxydans]CEJ08290.1 Exopolysaccharide biosynthesis protein [Acididesulfobacillus acetoxydans]